MIAFGCPKDCPPCRHCGSCFHLCGKKCAGARREKAIRSRRPHSATDRGPIR